MAKSKHAKRYPKEFHRQMVELHRAGRTLSELSREFGCKDSGNPVLAPIFMNV